MNEQHCPCDSRWVPSKLEEPEFPVPGEEAEYLPCNPEEAEVLIREWGGIGVWAEIVLPRSVGGAYAAHIYFPVGSASWACYTEIEARSWCEQMVGSFEEWLTRYCQKAYQKELAPEIDHLRQGIMGLMAKLTSLTPLEILLTQADEIPSERPST